MNGQFRGGLWKLVFDVNRRTTAPARIVRSWLGFELKLSEMHSTAICLIGHLQDKNGYVTVKDIRYYFYPEGSVVRPRRAAYDLLQRLKDEHGLVERLDRGQYRLTKKGQEKYDRAQDYYQRQIWWTYVDPCPSLGQR